MSALHEVDVLVGNLSKTEVLTSKQVYHAIPVLIVFFNEHCS